MAFRKRQRKVLLALGLLLGAAALVWFSMPLWFPWVSAPLARSQGVRFSRYTRAGFTRFVLENLSVTNRNLTLHAERVEAELPSAWLWHLAVRSTPPQRPLVSARNWQIEIASSPSPASTASRSATSAVGSAYGEVQNLLAALRSIQRWLPRAAFSNGTVRVAHTVVAVPMLVWSGGHVLARVELPERAQRANLSADIGRTLRLDLQSDSLQLKSALTLSTNATGMDLQITNLWRSNRIDVQVHFGLAGTLPQTALLRAKGFRLPALVGSLPGYDQPAGSLSLSWVQGGFTFDVTAEAQPLDERTHLPPLALALHATGDTHAATIHTAAISSPWLNANLSRDLTLHFRGPLLLQPAAFSLAADLSGQRWLPLRGRLSGAADFQPSTGRFPSARFHLSGSQIGNASLTAQSLSLSAGFDWPRLEIERAEASFSGGLSATAAVQMDLETMSLAEGHIELAGPLGRPWLPRGYSCQGFSLSAHLSGPLAQLDHHGRLDATNFTSPKFQPLQLQVEWAGRQTNFQRIAAFVNASTSALRAEAALSASNSQTRLRFSALSLLTNGQPALELAQPFELTLVKGSSNELRQLRTTPINLSGKTGQVRAQASLDWPEAGELSLSFEKVSSGLVAPFFKPSLPTIEINRLVGSAAWSNGPARFNLELSAVEQASEHREPTVSSSSPVSVPPPQSISSLAFPMAAELQLSGDPKGITLSNLSITTRTSVLAVAHGFLPLTVNPAESHKLLRPLPAESMQFAVSVEPKALVWDQLAEWTGVRLSEPSLDVALSGLWEGPVGRIELRAHQIQFHLASTNLPVLKDLQLTLELDRQHARLLGADVLVQGQRVNLNGDLPLGAGFWSGLLYLQPPDWGKATGHLRIENAELAVFAPLFPSILAPQGGLKLDLTLLAGGKLDGLLTLQRASTRSLGDLGSIRDIDAKLRFRERTLSLENASARVSGAPVHLAGQVDLGGTEWLHGVLPPFAFTLRGTNVPLARQPEFIVRSDLDLAATHTNRSPVVISGSAHLRDSYYLSDLAALVPGKVASPSQRPPYFSVSDPAVANWRLGVAVDGLRFLKVRTPIFDGVVSANLQLQGTLREPLALGDLKIDSGLVRFPFASLQIQQGLISSTSQDPYHPQLSVSASSKQFGYEIRMDLTGPIDSPIVQFSSTPPLSSERILLMVTAGELPQATFSLTPQQRAQTIALFFGRDLLTQLGLGEQGEARLSVRSGEEISQQGRQTDQVEYKLNDSWSLVGEYDRFGDFNAGFKWRIYSK